jgi:hypothetical protein
MEAEMKVAPVEQLNVPAYPAARAANAGALLAKHVPERWRKAKRLAGALAVVAAANLSSGCGSTVSDKTAQKPRLYVCNPPTDTEQDPLVAKVSGWIRSVYGKPSFAVRVPPPPMPVQSPSQALIMGGIPARLPRVSEEGPGIGPGSP